MGNASSRSKKNRRPNIIQQELFQAVKDGNLKLLMDYSTEYDLTRYAKKAGQSILHEAVIAGQFDCLKFLLSLGVPVDDSDSVLNTPLLCAASTKSSKSKLELIDYLLELKADINARNIWKRTPLLESIISFQDNVTQMLIKEGADTDIGDNDGLLPIHVCVSYRKPELLKILLEAGASVDGQDTKGRTALYFSVLYGYTEMLPLLFKYCCDVNLPSSFGTPLQTGIVKCNADIVKLLLENGANTVDKITEKRSAYSKASNYLELSTLIFHQTIIDGRPLNSVSNFQQSLRVLYLVLKAHGKEYQIRPKFLQPLFQSLHQLVISEPKSFSMGKEIPRIKKLLQDLINKLCLQGSVEIMGAVKDFIKTLPEGSTFTAGGKVTLQELCCLRIRSILMQNGKNVICNVGRLDIVPVLKGVLLLNE
ncbi:hypothetical protein CHS0354_011863 [Potamilus streckersoni]|uniref:Ankyrin repeat protein n=1 Tax=Potamilus streckersoni TaxID=2493646 RepID=A0AAE0TBV0_9BIVA|nr:hypothetical protein CHS0354_011863 [Potamilus streckersoni]